MRHLSSYEREGGGGGGHVTGPEPDDLAGRAWTRARHTRRATEIYKKVSGECSPCGSDAPMARLVAFFDTLCFPGSSLLPAVVSSRPNDDIPIARARGGA